MQTATEGSSILRPLRKRVREMMSASWHIIVGPFGVTFGCEVVSNAVAYHRLPCQHVYRDRDVLSKQPNDLLISPILLFRSLPCMIVSHLAFCDHNLRS